VPDLAYLIFSPSRPEAFAAAMLWQIHRHLSLIPLFCQWDRKNNPEPWNKLDVSDQYKFYSVNVDYSKLKKGGSDF